MIIKENASLKDMTTVRVGGTAKRLVTPESEEELKTFIEEEHPEYFIGGGSNLLINDREFDLVVDLRSFNKEIKDLGKGCFLVGASVRLQKAIDYVNEKGYGGMEFLYSVPGLIGGAVVMNAGRGKAQHCNISKYIVAVNTITDGKEKTYGNSECKFSHRDSIFKNSDIIITSVLFMFDEINKEETKAAKKDRLYFSKTKQDNSHPNFGSVFMDFDPFVMEMMRKMRSGNSRAGFSGKTRNWILNKDDAKYEDILKAIHKAEKMHKLFFRKCKPEVIIWR